MVQIATPSLSPEQDGETDNNTSENSFWYRLKKAWQERGTLDDDKIDEHHIAFLPAALEIQHTPPNRIAKRLGQLIIALFVIGIAWACIGKVNVVATAEGKIIPGDRIKHIQPLEKGIVRKIHVRSGDHVKKGQTLVELDSTLTAADLARISNSLQTARLNRLRLQQLIALLQGESNNVALPAENTRGEPLAKDEQYWQQNQQLQQQWQHYQAQLGSQQSSLAGRRAELDSIRADIDRLEQTLPIISQRAKNYKTLLETQMVSEENYLVTEQERIEKSQELVAQKARARQLTAGIEEVQQRIAALKSETLAHTWQQLNQTSEEVKALQQELNKANNKNANQVLYAPVDGVVQELQITTIGGVVTEAQNLMTIVPDDEKLEVQAFLENKDIGFVKTGMPAEIKIQTFPFTKYGVINASVKTITDDALADQEKGLFFAMLLQLDKNTINVNGEDIRLKPGMQTTVEVQTGERRIIEYLLTPVMKGFKESVRER